ncbi:hypothetical protein [Moorena bouillonii]|uniref:Uncharacterized protein n=1 Tax=Moorena bouillonii PNG TaxID=568701 RepID=A0A1U7N7K4_9CYAN|nr:hypothetical protein [Moorena bouillonii]NEO47117.1 hypothetical protein [Moorena sp. SIO4A3]OLT61930.1 hypothetical protein BJP37_25760 [Moorena bouillonii PNG]
MASNPLTVGHAGRVRHYGLGETPIRFLHQNNVNNKERLILPLLLTAGSIKTIMNGLQSNQM